MAEALLSALDRKYGTGHTADPVFFVYGDTIFELYVLLNFELFRSNPYTAVAL